MDDWLLVLVIPFIKLSLGIFMLATYRPILRNDPGTKQLYSPASALWLLCSSTWFLCCQLPPMLLYLVLYAVMPPLMAIVMHWRGPTYMTVVVLHLVGRLPKIHQFVRSTIIVLSVLCYSASILGFAEWMPKLHARLMVPMQILASAILGCHFTVDAMVELLSPPDENCLGIMLESFFVPGMRILACHTLFSRLFLIFAFSM
jgi:hypothetical protein